MFVPQFEIYGWRKVITIELRRYQEWELLHSSYTCEDKIAIANNDFEAIKAASYLLT